MPRWISYFDIRMQGFGVDISEIEEATADASGYNTVNTSSIECDSMVVLKMPFYFMNSGRQSRSGIIRAFIADIVESVGLMS